MYILSVSKAYWRLEPITILSSQVIINFMINFALKQYERYQVLPVAHHFQNKIYTILFFILFTLIISFDEKS